MLSSRLRVRHRPILVLCSASVVACSSNEAPVNNQAGGALSVGGSSFYTGGASQLGGTGTLVATGGTPSATTGGNSAVGGSTASASGGTKPTGGASSTGAGAGSSAGGSSAVSTGGMKSTGGVSSTTAGGASSVASGGTKNSGGSDSSGGTRATGGNSAAITGGTNVGGTSTVTPTGGAGATAGSAATGGRAATGGSSAIPTGLPATCGTTNCDNATPVNPQLTSYGALGNVTMYSTSASTGGACLYGTTSIMYYGAINVNLSPGDAKGQWQGGTICGQCFEVTVVTSQGYESVVIRVTDKCPDGQCGMDLGGSAPAAVMVDGVGRYQGAWRAVSCAGHSEVSDGVPSIHVKDGSNGGWSVIQVRNPVMAVAGIDYQDEMNGAIRGSMSLSSGIENYYQVPTTVLASFSTIDITVHYVDGSTAKAALTATQLSTPEGTYPLS